MEFFEKLVIQDVIKMIRDDSRFNQDFTANQSRLIKINQDLIKFPENSKKIKIQKIYIFKL